MITFPSSIIFKNLAKFFSGDLIADAIERLQKNTHFPPFIMYNSPVMELNDLTQAMDRFVTAKGWYQPSTPRPQTLKNLAASLCIEAAEVLELFQWAEEVSDPAALESELADVALYLLQLARVAGINLESAVLDKLKTNYDRTWDQPPPAERDQHVTQD
jgi:NTP pyrophosphatase (non-canonical NTP hydrolase)